jgi:hypothetical protein
MHRPPSLAASVSALVLLVAALAGCGSSSSSSSSSSNGVAAKTATEIVAASKAAADSASSTHVVGSIVSSGSPIALNLYLASGKGGHGQVSESGLSFELIAVDGSVYIKGSPAFYSHFGGGAAAQLLKGKWLKAPASNANFASIAAFTDLGKLLGAALTSHGKLAKGATTTVNGQPAVGVTDTAQGGTLYVATTGQPYPIEIIKRGASGGKITFSEWNAPVQLTAPANSIDLSQLQSGR